MIKACETCRNYGKCIICQDCTDENDCFEYLTIEEMFRAEANDPKLKVFNEDGTLTDDAMKYYNDVAEGYFDNIDEADEYIDAATRLD